MTDKVLITGGASGLGLARGANVWIADINTQYMDEARQTLSAYADNVRFSLCDITQEASIEALKIEIQNAWQGLDILVNNAGVATGGALEFEDIEQWQWVLDINVLGLVRMTRAMVPLLTASSRTHDATIINIASQAGITPIQMMGSYNASKAAVVSFSETMNLELASQGIHVCAACPSFFPTNLDKSLRTKQPGLDKVVSKLLTRSDLSADDVANIIAEQAKRKRFMIITHKDGRMAFNMKRFLPMGRYLRMVRNKTKNLGRIREQ